MESSPPRLLDGLEVEVVVLGRDLGIGEHQHPAIFHHHARVVEVTDVADGYCARPRMPVRGAAPVLAAVALAALSLLVVAPAPSYDPWAWLLWGRELAGGGLDTREGPAFKPLPVAVCALLAPLGGAAPVVWVRSSRAAAVLALWLAFRLGRRLAGGSLWAGLLAAAGVALCGRFLAYSAAGAEPALLLALALGGRGGLAGGARAARARVRARLRAGARGDLAVPGGGRRVAVAGAARAAPSLLAARRRWSPPRGSCPSSRARASSCAPPTAPASPIRASPRSRPSPPSRPSARPPACSCGRCGSASRRWPRRPPADWRRAEGRGGRAAGGAARGGRGAPSAAVGLGWVAVVAGMAQAGFSGEARYAVPGVALVAVSGAAGLVLAARRSPRPLAAAVLAAALLAVPLGARARGARRRARRQAYQWQLASELARRRARGGRARGRARVRPALRRPLPWAADGLPARRRQGGGRARRGAARARRRVPLRAHPHRRADAGRAARARRRWSRRRCGASSATVRLRVP